MATPEDLEIFIENTTDELQDFIAEINDGEELDAQLGQLFSDICTNYRRRAIAWLLLEADTAAFSRDLYNSAQAFLFFLNQARDNSAIDRYPLTTGRSAPFFDAVASQSNDLAKSIALNSKQVFSEGDEYEDDFYYHYFLMQLYLKEVDEKSLAKILDRFSSEVTGESSYKLAICKALSDQDSQLFNDSLNELLLAHQETYHRYREQEKEHDEIIDTEGNISVEGLALVRLAEIRHMMTAKEYPLIPSLAKQTSPMVSQPEDAWKSP